MLPQLRALGRSSIAHTYGIAGREEAAAYIAHPVLGPRLVECVETLLSHPDKPAIDMLGPVDALKLRSCLTLFAAVAPQLPCFADALAVFCEGRPDDATLHLLGVDRLPQDR